MPDYKKMYFQLAARVSDAVEILLKAQQEGEAQFMAEVRSSEVKVLPIRQDESKEDKNDND
mgnify:CR=1 FL=1